MSEIKPIESLTIVSLGHSRYIVTAINEVIETIKRKDIQVNHNGISMHKWYQSDISKKEHVYQAYSCSFDFLPRASDRKTPYWDTPHIDHEVQRSLPLIADFLENLTAAAQPDVFLIGDDWGPLEVFVMEFFNWKRIPVVFLEHAAAVFNAPFAKTGETGAKIRQDWENKRYHLPQVCPSGQNAEYFICSYSAPSMQMMVQSGVDSSVLRGTGFPYFDRIVRARREAQAKKTSRKKKLLMISNGRGTFGGTFRQSALSYYKFLTEIIPKVQDDYEIALRLKPGENPEKFLTPEVLHELGIQNMRIDDNALESYEAIQKYDVVVGEMSTVLVEALMLNTPVVLVDLQSDPLRRKQLDNRWFLKHVIGVVTISDASNPREIIDAAASANYLANCTAKLHKYQGYFFNIDGMSGKRCAQVIFEAVARNLINKEKTAEAYRYLVCGNRYFAGSSELLGLQAALEQLWGRPPAPRGNSEVRASVIIPTLNRARSLKIVLDSIFAQEYPARRFEIIVVDNGSTDKTKSVVDSVMAHNPDQKIRYVFEPVPGLLSGRHRGAEEAEAEILIFVDDDIEAFPAWLSSIIEAFSDPSVHLVGGPSLPKFEVTPPDWISKYWTVKNAKINCGPLSLFHLGDEKVGIDPTYVWGLNYAIRKKAFFELGGFHPDCIPKGLQHFQGDGETGLSLKLKEKGLKAAYVPGAKVYHHIPKERLTVEYFEKRFFYQGVCDSYTQIRRNRGLSNKQIPRCKVNGPNFSDDSASGYDTQAIHQRIHKAYVAGFIFHQDAVKKSKLLLGWVLKENYLDYRLPVLGGKWIDPTENMTHFQPYAGKTRNQTNANPGFTTNSDQRNILAQKANMHRQFSCDHTIDPLKHQRFFVKLKDRLIHLGIAVEQETIDLVDFEYWLQLNPEIKRSYLSYGDVIIEKCLEHYLTYRYLGMDQKDVFIDVAAAGSPWAEILNKKNIRSYRLDKAYPPGINGLNIGADACDTKLPDNICSALALHCAYECFMGDADTKFLKEAGRILSEKGRMAAIPLYLEDKFFVVTSALCDQKKVFVDEGALKVWRDDQYAVPFSRHYSPEFFLQRVYSNVPEDMTAKVIFFKNLDEAAKRYPGQRIYCYFMFFCQKKSDLTSANK